MERDKLIKKYKKQIEKLFKELPKNKMELFQGVIENAARTRVDLDIFEEEKQKGYMIQTTNGNGFSTEKENPAYNTYNRALSTYQKLIDTLNKELPQQIEKSKLEELFRE